MGQTLARSGYSDTGTQIQARLPAASLASLIIFDVFWKFISHSEYGITERLVFRVLGIFYCKLDMGKLR